MRKEERKCIVCKSDNATELFCYNYSYLTEIRGADKHHLKKKGFNEAETSTIVKCGVCGCNYIRDVLIDYQLASEREKNRLLGVKKEKDIVHSFSQIREASNIDKNWRLAQLYRSLSRYKLTGKGPLRVLDFGAGSAGFSRLASVIGADRCVAYDLAYAKDVQLVFDKVCPPGITATNDFRVVEEEGPYDIVFCQSMIEHVTNPRAVMESIHNVVSADGLVYINNPIMDLDREIGALKSAKKITKKDKLSYYHPGHLNYMTPKHFLKIASDVGFEVVPLYIEPVRLRKNSTFMNLLSFANKICKMLYVKIWPSSSRSFYVLRKRD